MARIKHTQKEGRTLPHSYSHDVQIMTSAVRDDLMRRKIFPSAHNPLRHTDLSDPEEIYNAQRAAHFRRTLEGIFGRRLTEADLGCIARALGDNTSPRPQGPNDTI